MTRIAMLFSGVSLFLFVCLAFKRPWKQALWQSLVTAALVVIEPLRGIAAALGFIWVWQQVNKRFDLLPPVTLFLVSYVLGFVYGLVFMFAIEIAAIASALGLGTLVQEFKSYFRKELASSNVNN